LRSGGALLPPLQPTLAMADPQLLAALDLMRRMPPSRCETSLEELVDLVPHLTDDLLNTIDQPLQTAKDAQGNAYLLCDYNRDGDSYRSPWTNEYDPPLSDGVLPSPKLRAMETLANDIFEGYREMYYEGGISSVYFWDLDESSFAACVLVKKDAEEKKKLEAGNWDAIHVVEVRPLGPKRAAYKLTTTIMLRIKTGHAVGVHEGEMNLSGSLTRQKEEELAVGDVASHVANMGRMVEEMENRMRDTLQSIYFGKTKSVVNGLYQSGGAEANKKKDMLAQALMAEMGKRNAD